jgi:hypothetical protein
MSEWFVRGIGGILVSAGLNCTTLCCYVLRCAVLCCYVLSCAALCFYVLSCAALRCAVMC